MISVRLMGGLGNQLFQVAAMLHLRDSGAGRVRCETSWFAHQGSDDTHRDLEVAPVLRHGDAYRMPRPVLRGLRLIDGIQVREQGPGDDALARLPGRWAVAEGYFQRAEHALAVRAELAERLLPVLGPIEQQPRIGVHVRLGDYLHQPATQAFHGVTDVSYYLDGIAAARATLGELPIMVFTDSPEAFDQRFRDWFPTGTTVAASAGSWPTLAAMSACAGLVVSNSSFSWWAAFTGSQLRATPMSVVLPRPWFTETSPADHLLLVDGWQQIERGVQVG